MPDFYQIAPGLNRPAGRRALSQSWLPCLAALLLSLPGWAQTPVLTSRSPAAHTVTASATANLSLTFSQPLAPATAPGLRVWGSQRRGLRPGVASLPSPAVLSFDPSQDFAPGEEVSVSVPATLTSAGGVAVAPYAYQFRVAASPSSGTFGSSTATTMGASPQRAWLADLDNDGDLDLLTSLNSGAAFRRNNGTGAFAAVAISIGLPGGLSDIVATDFDNDGDLDVLGCNGSSQLRFQRNNGAGVFTNGNANFISVGSGAEHLALADVDADGDLDLLVTYPSDNAVGLHFNNGSGSFGPTVSVPTAGIPTALAVGDTDNDGDLDLLVSNADLDLVSTYPNDGSGSFGSPSDTFVGGYPVALALADLSGDGRPDLLTLNANDHTLSVRLGSATGFRGNSAVPVPTTTAGFTLGDVDGDGDLDIVLAAESANADVLLNNGLAAFSSSLAADQQHAYASVALGDLDGDGDLDPGRHRWLGHHGPAALQPRLAPHHRLYARQRRRGQQRHHQRRQLHRGHHRELQRRGRRHGRLRGERRRHQHHLDRAPGRYQWANTGDYAGRHGRIGRQLHGGHGRAAHQPQPGPQPAGRAAQQQRDAGLLASGGGRQRNHHSAARQPPPPHGHLQRGRHGQHQLRPRPGLRAG
jgi:hypothetical protein